MTEKFAEIRIRGRDTLVPAEDVCGRTTIVTGRWLRVARVMDEDEVEGDVVADPNAYLSALKRSGLRADVFTFAERPPQRTPRYPFHVVWGNWAVLTIGRYEDWWEGLPQETRKNVRRAQKRQVTVRSVPFDRELVRAISEIYNETPIRQGRRFWHYGRDLEFVERMNATYMDRSEFIGAYFEGQLIGFIKMVFVGHFAELMQIVSMEAHRDKRPMNALVAHAVQVCVDRGCPFLVYGQYTYGNDADSSLAEFKRRNGFQQFDLPRYYVPLTIKGKFATMTGLHLGVGNLIPRWARSRLVRVRARAVQMWSRASSRRVARDAAS